MADGCYANYLIKKSIAMIQLTTEMFKKDIYNYSASSEWKFEGNLPAIIDFYSDHCGLCRMLAPMLEQLSEEYKGKVNIYKVNTGEEIELSSLFGVNYTPTLLFIPKDKKPMIQPGSLSKNTIIEVIKNELL
jgi:thioredoxin